MLVDSRIYDAFLAHLQNEGGYLVNEDEPLAAEAAYWDSEGGEPPGHDRARRKASSRRKPASRFRMARSFFIVPERLIGKTQPFSSEKLCVVLSIFKYHGFDMALDMVRQIFWRRSGKGHSCGIFSFDDDPTSHRLAPRRAR